MSAPRVGPTQWIILGALAQAPGQVLTRAQLRRHLFSLGIDAGMSRSVLQLLKAGMIDDTCHGGTYQLTEFGADCRKDGRPSETPSFMLLLNSALMAQRD